MNQDGLPSLSSPPPPHLPLLDAPANLAGKDKGHKGVAAELGLDEEGAPANGRVVEANLVRVLGNFHGLGCVPEHRVQASTCRR